MKCVIPEISYHNRYRLKIIYEYLKVSVTRDPVLSIDFQLNGEDGVKRLATAGSDNHVVVRVLS